MSEKEDVKKQEREDHRKVAYIYYAKAPFDPDKGEIKCHVQQSDTPIFY